jgi:recombination protein RecA
MGKAVAFLQKKLGERAFEGTGPIVGLSTGCLAVDIVSGVGGFPRGRVTEVFGPEGSGKSTLCTTACAKAQANGLTVVYVDAERSLIEEHALKLGFDPRQPGAWIKPRTFEDMLTIVETMCQEAEADLILVDSVPALIPKAVLEGDITEMSHYGQAARMFSQALPRLAALIEDSKTALVLVNQLRANISQNTWAARFEPREKTFGGNALRYYSSLRLELRQLDKKAVEREVPHPLEVGKMNKIPVASLHRGIVIKSKVAAPYQQLDFFIRFDPILNRWGIDNLQTRIEMATAQTPPLIERKHGGIAIFETSAGEKVSVRGDDALYDWFAERPDEVKALKNRLNIKV